MFAATLEVALAIAVLPQEVLVVSTMYSIKPALPYPLELLLVIIRQLIPVGVLINC